MFAVSIPPETSGNNGKKTIIEMANAAYSIKSGPPSSSESNGSRNNMTSSNATLDERLDAARAMLGISPCSVTDSSVGMASIMGGRGGANRTVKQRKPKAINGFNGISTGHSQRLQQQQQQQQSLRFQGTREDSRKESTASSLVSLSIASESSSSGNDANSASSSGRRSRSNSAGLDALAFLATQEQEASALTLTRRTATTSVPASTATATATPSNEHLTVPYSGLPVVPTPAVTSSDDDDSEIMPPPPPRSTTVNVRRRRSVSNPEGMGDKWGLAPSIASQTTKTTATTTTTTAVRTLRFLLPTSILEEEMAEANAAVIAKEKSTASASALAASLLRSDAANHHRIMNIHRVKLPKLVEEEAEDEVDADEHSEEEEEDEDNLDHEELLRRARSRLLEDLSQSNLSGEKGVLTLPHSLRKYKEVYNKNGRIGIYTPAERAAIIARFQSKRTRRVWNKKIRYNCRKNLADRRLRVKGRFVKRSVTEAPAATVEAPKILSSTAKGATATATQKTSNTPALASAALAPSSVPQDTVVNRDTEMPDVSDPDAGFCPTNDQPYRRLRRHTIT